MASLTTPMTLRESQAAAQVIFYTHPDTLIIVQLTEKIQPTVNLILNIKQFAGLFVKCYALLGVLHLLKILSVFLT